LSAENVISRTVRDTAAVLDAIAGPDPGAPYRAPPAPDSFLKAMRQPPERLRIAFTARSFLGGPVDAEVAAAVDDAARLLEGLGHVVEEAVPGEVDFDATLRAMVTLIACGVAWSVGEKTKLRGRGPRDDELEPSTRGALELARRTTGPEYLGCVATIHRAGRRIAGFFDRYDVLMTPVLARLPAPLGVYSMHKPDFLDYRLGPGAISEYSPFTPIANATGQPAMSVPLARARNGLPIGTHFIGRFGDEATLLALAAQLEQARPWFDQRPPMFADGGTPPRSPSELPTG
jgi:Asp-tRNA(Asn)/Glu-tRNA(Gln) amidotransferase A subunit family amidase